MGRQGETVPRTLAMINGIYPFPPKDLAEGESAELRLELTQVFALGYFRPSRLNIDDVWVDDILIGDRSLMPKLPNGDSASIPLAIFFEATLTFDDAIIPIGVPLIVKVTNHSKNTRNIRLAVFGTNQRKDC